METNDIWKEQLIAGILCRKKFKLKSLKETSLLNITSTQTRNYATFGFRTIWNE